jgi:hypothetical protein
MTTLGHAAKTTWHMTARFFTSLSTTPPSDAERAWVEARLRPAELELWEQMSVQDRRHGTQVAMRFATRRPQATRAELAGAILHDVGKITCDLGTFGRVAATIVGPRGRRFRLYHDHESIGARMAADIGSDPATVELIAGRGPAFDDLEACDHA